MWRPALLARPVLLAVGVLALVACSDDEPPDWLIERGAAAATTTTSAPSATTVPGGSTTTVVAPGESVAAIELAEGDCLAVAEFSTADVPEISLVPVVACADEHAAEVYVHFDLRIGPEAAFPGADDLRQRAQTRCREQFRGFVGRPWSESELDIAALWPTQESWAAGDRSVTCAVFRADGEPLVGTARNADV